MFFLLCFVLYCFTQCVLVHRHTGNKTEWKNIVWRERRLRLCGSKVVGSAPTTLSTSRRMLFEAVSLAHCSKESMNVLHPYRGRGEGLVINVLHPYRGRGEGLVINVLHPYRGRGEGLVINVLHPCTAPLQRERRGVSY